MKYFYIHIFYFIWNTKSSMRIANSIATSTAFINLIQDRPFEDCSQMGLTKEIHVPKICHPYCTLVKFATLMQYLEKIKKT